MRYNRRRYELIAININNTYTIELTSKCPFENQKLVPNGHKYIQEEREAGGLVFDSGIAKIPQLTSTYLMMSG